MFHTAEVRWFGRGRLPPAVQSWFSNCPGGGPSSEQRIDTYLLTHVENLGIKIREGRLEVKFRRRGMGQREFPPKLTGLVEHWTKVGFGVEADSQKTTSERQPGTRWLEIKKARVVRHYIQTGSGKIVSLNTGATASSPTQLEVDYGCSLEITAIEVPQGHWWSVGLEAFGTDESREELLVAVTKFLAKTYDSPPLELHFSYGYPTWLTRL